jgi:hypothetical protein
MFTIIVTYSKNWFVKFKMEFRIRNQLIHQLNHIQKNNQA